MSNSEPTCATCRWCGQTMDGRPCAGEAIRIENAIYQRIPYASQTELATAADPSITSPEHCHDCATPTHGLHHPGCDMERCPRCHGQVISCDCHWDGDLQPQPQPTADS